MADMSVETSRIRDVVRDSKIRSDISSMLNQSSDSFLLGSFQGLAEQRHHRTRDVHRVGRDFPRVSADEVVRKVLRCNSREENKRLDFNFKFDEGESWVHGWNGNEDPFNEFYDGYSDSDSLIVRFKRNLPDFVGFWHMEDLLTWIDAIDDFFEEVSPPEHVKCKIVLYKMKGAAYYWWRRLQADRNEIGKDEIISWPRMKNLLLKRFSPTKCSTKCPSQQNQKVEEGMEVVKDLKADKFTPNNCSTKVSGEPDRIKPSKKDDDESLCASGMSAYEIHHYLGPNKAVHFDTCKDSECEKPSSNVAITEEFEFGDATPEQPSQEEVNQFIILNAQTVEVFLGEHDSQDNINTNVAEKTMSTCDEMETLKEISGILAISSNGTDLMQEIMVDELKKVEFIPTSIYLDDVMKINPTPVIVSEMDLASSNSTPEKYSEPKALSWKIIAYCDGVFENHFEKGTKSQSVGVGGNAKVVGFLFDPGGIDDVQSLHIVIIRLDSFGLIFSEVNAKEGFIMSSLSIAMTRTLQELVYHVTGEILQTTYSLDWTVSFLSLAGHPPNAIETFVEALELMPHEKSLNETLKGCFTDEFGVLLPNQLQVNELYVWEVGYLSASIKSIGNAREGDIQDKYDSKIELELQHKVTCMHSRHLPIGASILTKRFWEPIYGPNNQNSELSHEERGCIRIDDLQWMSRVAVVLEFFLDDNTCRSTCLNREYEVKDVSLASQSSEFGDKGENKEMDDPVVGVNPGISSFSQYENEVKGESETNISHGSQLSSVEVGGLKEESTSTENESLAIEYSPSTGRHALTLEVGASLMRFIKGKWGSTQKSIEDETGARLIFPPSRKDDAITIEGYSAESVTNASRKIEAIIHESVNSTRLDYSHFVSLPLAVHPELVDKLVEFQKSILETSEATTEVAVEPEGPIELAVTLAAEEIVLNPEDDASNKQLTVGGTNIPLVSYAPKRSKTSSVELTTSKLSDMGIDSSIFNKPKTFHLTVLMLKLWNKERLEAAAKVLQSVSSKVVDALDSRPISIRLKGLECMKGSFAKARVLYVPIEEVGEEGRLLRACQVIIDAFVEAGLVLERDAQHKLKLHATLMNVRHRKRQVIRRRNNDFFDASKIAEQYGTMEWGEFVIPQAHLSERFAFDENGYYHCCASIPFPENMQQQD